MAPSMDMVVHRPSDPVIIDITKSQAYSMAKILFSDEALKKITNSNMTVEAAYIEVGASLVMVAGTNASLQLIMFKNDECALVLNYLRSNSDEDKQYGFELGVGAKVGIGIFNHDNGKFSEPTAESFVDGEGSFLSVGTPMGAVSFSGNFTNGKCEWANSSNSIWTNMSISSPEMGIGVPGIDIGASVGCGQAMILGNQNTCKDADFENPNYFKDFQALQRQDKVMNYLNQSLSN